MYRIINKTHQPIALEDGKRIFSKSFIEIAEISSQIRAIEKMGLVKIKYIKNT